MNNHPADGLLRLHPQQLSDLTWVHLISGIDDDVLAESAVRCGASTTLSGYTEWISTEEPGVTLGWDWQLDAQSAAPRVVRLGLPRTNVLVLRGDKDPLPWEHSLEVLASFIDGFDWNTTAFDAVCGRYAS